MNDSSNIIDLWNDLKRIVNDLEVDVVKNSRGTASAGVRLRKGLRDLKTKAVEITRLTIKVDKINKAERTKKPKA